MITILTIYLIVAIISALATSLLMLYGESIDDIDTFWDWVVYNLFWGLHLIKAIVKQLKNIYKLR